MIAKSQVSLLAEACREADRHKWIESERCRRDLGVAAIRQWTTEHWTAFVRARWDEHLEGKRYWPELDHGDFGILPRLYDHNHELVREIHHRLRSGQENLDIIRWALEYHLDLDEILPILQAFDINRCQNLPTPG